MTLTLYLHAQQFHTSERTKSLKQQSISNTTTATKYLTVISLMPRDLAHDLIYGRWSNEGFS